jgi:hypothetical protein
VGSLPRAWGAGRCGRSPNRYGVGLMKRMLERLFCRVNFTPFIQEIERRAKPRTR